MATPAYDYYLVENSYVARFDPETGDAAALREDGTWVASLRTPEICNGRPLDDEQDALDTAAFLVERNRKREAERRGGS